MTVGGPKREGDSAGPGAAVFVPELQILPVIQRALWPDLRPLRNQGFVLYGGTAISLRLGHRISVDFDFFTDRPLEHAGLIAELPFGGRSRVLQEAPDTLTLLVPSEEGSKEGVKVSFFGGMTMGRVGTPDLSSDGVLAAASLLDLMGTKLKVIQQRAEKKDYVDIHALLGWGVRLEDGLAAGKALFGRTFQPSEALKALAYFGDGDLGDLPQDVRGSLARTSASVTRIPVLAIRSSQLGPGEP